MYCKINAKYRGLDQKHDHCSSFSIISKKILHNLILKRYCNVWVVGLTGALQTSVEDEEQGLDSRLWNVLESTVNGNMIAKLSKPIVLFQFSNNFQRFSMRFEAWSWNQKICKSFLNPPFETNVLQKKIMIQHLETKVFEDSFSCSKNLCRTRLVNKGFWRFF